MKLRSLLILLAVGTLVQTAGEQAPQAPPGRGANPGGRGAAPAPVRSPEVAADRRVTFRVSAPKATEVRLTCECVKDPVAMTKDQQGVWSATVGPIEPDMYEFEFNVDGISIPDSRNTFIKYISRPVPFASMLIVPVTGPMFYVVMPVAQGSVDHMRPDVGR